MTPSTINDHINYRIIKAHSDYQTISMASMYKLVQTINSTKFRTEPFEEFYEVFEEIGR